MRLIMTGVASTATRPLPTRGAVCSSATTSSAVPTSPAWIVELGIKSLVPLSWHPILPATVTNPLSPGLDWGQYGAVLAFPDRGKPDESPGRKATGLKRKAKAAGLRRGQRPPARRAVVVTQGRSGRDH